MVSCKFVVIKTYWTWNEFACNNFEISVKLEGCFDGPQTTSGDFVCDRTGGFEHRTWEETFFRKITGKMTKHFSGIFGSLEFVEIASKMTNHFLGIVGLLEIWKITSKMTKHFSRIVGSLEICNFTSKITKHFSGIFGSFEIWKITSKMKNHFSGIVNSLEFVKMKNGQLWKL